MKLNVLQELRQSVGSLTRLSIDEPSVQLNGLTLRRLDGSLSLLRTDRGLLASFDGHGHLREWCSRCLVETDCEIDIRFDEEFVPVTDANSGARIGIPADDDAFRIGPDFMLDLREAVREYLLMTEPLNPLCAPDCAGLCATCGANLNEGACGCSLVPDERWGALAGFNNRNSKGN